MMTFYQQLATTPEPQRIAFVEQLRADGDLKRAGEMLLDVLDKAVTAEKAHLIGQLLRVLHQQRRAMDRLRAHERDDRDGVPR